MTSYNSKFDTQEGGKGRTDCSCQIARSAHARIYLTDDMAWQTHASPSNKRSGHRSLRREEHEPSQQSSLPPPNNSQKSRNGDEPARSVHTLKRRTEDEPSEGDLVENERAERERENENERGHLMLKVSRRSGGTQDGRRRVTPMPKSSDHVE